VRQRRYFQGHVNNGAYAPTPNSFLFSELVLKRSSKQKPLFSGAAFVV